MSDLDVQRIINQDMAKLDENMQRLVDAFELVVMRLTNAEEVQQEVIAAIQQYKDGFLELKSRVEALESGEPRDPTDEGKEL